MMALIEAPAATCMFHGGGRSTLSVCPGHTLKNLLQHHLLKLAIAIAHAHARAGPAALEKTLPSRLLPGFDSPKGLLQLASQASKAQQQRSSCLYRSYRFSKRITTPTRLANVSSECAVPGDARARVCHCLGLGFGSAKLTEARQFFRQAALAKRRQGRPLQPEMLRSQVKIPTCGHHKDASGLHQHLASYLFLKSSCSLRMGL